MKNSKLIAVLNDLIETCKDGEYGFTQCADHAVASELKTTLRLRAADCRASAQALQELVRIHGGHADTGGSLTGVLHRGWLGLRSAVFSRNEDKMVLEECERGENLAKERYTQALAQPLPDNVRQVVQHQYQGVLKNYAEIAALLDRYRSRADT